MDKETGGDRLVRLRLHANRQIEIINVYTPVAKAEYATEAQMEMEKDEF